MSPFHCFLALFLGFGLSLQAQSLCDCDRMLGADYYTPPEMTLRCQHPDTALICRMSSILVYDISIHYASRDGLTLTATVEGQMDGPTRQSFMMIQEGDYISYSNIYAIDPNNREVQLPPFAETASGNSMRTRSVRDWRRVSELAPEMKANTKLTYFTLEVKTASGLVISRDVEGDRFDKNSLPVDAVSYTFKDIFLQYKDDPIFEMESFTLESLD